MIIRPPLNELETIYESAPVGLCLISTDLVFQRVNREMAEMNGASVHDHLGAHVRDVVPHLEHVARHLMDTVMQTGEAVGPFEVVGETPAQPGIERTWMETWAPIRDERGSVVAAAIAAVEVTDRKRAEQEKNAALNSLKKRLDQQTALAQLNKSALNDLNLAQVMDNAVRIAADVLDLPMTKILRFVDSADMLQLVAGIGWQDGLVGSALVGIEEESQAGYTLFAKDPVIVDDLRTETRFSGPALLHQHKVRSGLSVVIEGTGDRPFGVFGVHTTERRSFDEADIGFLISLAAIVTNAARKEAAFAQRTLLVREMSHRAGNMLQMVSTIAGQTFQHIEDVDRARHVFSERLNSLARANHAISREGWEQTRVRSVVEQTLLPFKDRFNLGGRDVLLPPDLCFDLGLVLHEIATNSAKYGSLSGNNGIIDLTWRVKLEDVRRVFELVWVDYENNSPAPVQDAVPSSGFGTKLINMLFEKKWSGSVSEVIDDKYRLMLRFPIPGETVNGP